MSAVDNLGALIHVAVKAYGEGSDRSQQSAAGIMGPSDVGWCRQKAALMIKGTEQSDSTPIAAAQVGTAMHSYIAEALRAMFPTWIVDNEKVTATLPSGVEISGTPDIVIPEYNAVIDIKTVDGFSWVKREGTSLNHRYQRHLYAMGAIAAGMLDESKPIYVGNCYYDRSGKEPEPLLVIEEMDPTLTYEIDSWIGDVTYAVQHGEDAMRDIPSPICQKVCGFFTVCRGNLPDNDGGEPIDDDERLAAVRMYLDGRDMEKEGSSMKREAQSRLYGSSGIALVDGKPIQIRWTHVNATTVNSFEKQGFDRLDVRTLKNA